MAEIIEAIHKITYEVNDQALLKATDAIKAQIQELTSLNKSLLDVQKQLERTGKQEIARIEELSKKLETLVTKIGASAGKTKGLMEQLGDGFLKAAGAGDGLEGIVANFITPFIEGIPALLEGSATIGGLAAEVFTFSNVVTGSIAVLALLVSSMSDSEEEAADYGEAMKKAAEFSKALGEESAGEITQLVSLRAKVEDTTLSYQKRTDAAKQLQQLYPQYFGNLSTEEIMAGKVAGAYNKVTAAIIASARARVLEKSLEGVFEKLIPIEEKIKELAKQKGIELKVEVDDSGLSELQMSMADMTSRINPKYLHDITDPAANYAFKEKGNGKYGEIQHQLNEYKPLFEEAASLINLLKENNKNIPAPERTGGGGGGIATPKPAKQVDNTTPMERVKPLSSKPLPVTIEEPDIMQPDELNAMMQRQKEEEEKAARDAQEKRKARVKEMVSEYQNFAQEAIKAINAVLDAQIQALDKEIDLRKDRVSQAEKLAARGNAEVLRLETEQLNKAQEEREKKARQQMQLNALLQASNQAVALSEAIGAIIAAASEGDPYTIALRVAAAVASLVAGIASLSGAFSKANSFADGVVDYKGKGGPRDDANWVRISK